MSAEVMTIEECVAVLEVLKARSWPLLEATKNTYTGRMRPGYPVLVDNINPGGVFGLSLDPGFGVYFMTFGAAGVICGGLFSDWLRSRGYRDSNMRAGVCSALLSLPLVVTFPLLDQTLSLLLLAPAIFFGTMPFGTGPAALPLIVPNRLRGQLIAIYLLFGNLIGQGGGPWLVAVCTDFVLGDPQLIRYSISAVSSVTVLTGAVILLAGLKPYGAHMLKVEAEHT